MLFRSGEIDCEEESKKTTIKVYYNGEETKLRPLPDKFFNQVKSVYDGSYDGKPQPFSMKYMGNDTLTIDDEASNFKISNKKVCWDYITTQKTSH